jgi:hypothetical protein
LCLLLPFDRFLLIALLIETGKITYGPNYNESWFCLEIKLKDKKNSWPTNKCPRVSLKKEAENVGKDLTRKI